MVVTVAVIVAVGGYVLHGAGEYYAISPGTAPTVSASPDCKSVGGGNWALPGGRPCVRIDIPASKSAPVDGSIMMVDVLEGPATPWEFALAKLGLLHSLEDATVLYPKQAILGGSPASQLGCQQTQQMQGAQSAASVVALRALGYKVAEKNLGAQVVEVVPGTPAAAAGMECNDLITEVDGRPTPTSAALAAAIAGLTPGSPAIITVSRVASNGSTRVLVLHAKLTSVPSEGSTPADPHKAFLGVATQTDSSFSYPFPVSIDVGAIGGPSAGLALTLGLLDSLTHGQLTGGRRIAATGTISLDGAVGDVGGVAQKTVAVRKAGAQYFFVPVQELAAARSEAKGMKVYAVSTLAQALSDLEALGGSIPKSVVAKA
ncbi:MAG: PDZ domain-containing protein [Acidimicrobiales bacterium]